MIRLFLETGKKDTCEYVFMRTLLRYIGIAPTLFEIETTGGWGNLKHAANKLKETSLENGRNLIIFDADSPENDGGFVRRKAQLEQLLAAYDLHADIFLFPDHRTDGDFETLLENVMRRDLHQSLLDCFHDYENCLNADRYLKPNRKAKLYNFISSQKTLSSQQRRHLGTGDWCFENPDFWNLESQALLPLKQFLTDAFQL